MTKIHSVTVNSGVTPSRNNKPVRTPNWEPAIHMDDGTGSKRPGVYPMDDPRSGGLTVKLTVDASLSGRPLTLTGELGGMVFEGAFTAPGGDAAAGPQTVLAVPRRAPVNFTSIQGDMQWSLKVSGGAPTPLIKTRLELYWIYSEPGAMYQKGVWVEVLRRSASFLGEPGSRDDVIQSVVEYCHSGTRIIYDSKRGYNYYSETYQGGSFRLKAFLQEATPICNCYDQAGAVQTFLGAVGINDATWIYLQPYGYINTTDLIGRGECNTPFYLKKDPPTATVVPINDSQRSGFGNHAFCSIGAGDIIYDSTVGPHLGSEGKQQYVTDAIDTITDLYQVNDITPGTAADMEEKPGISDVAGFKPAEEETGVEEKRAAEDPFQRRLEHFKGLIQSAPLGLPPPPPGGLACPWPDPLTCPVLAGGNWAIVFDEIRAGRDTAIREWMLVQDDRRLRIEIFVGSMNPETAINRLISLGASTSLPDIPLARGPESLGDLSVVSPAVQGQKVIAAFFNACFMVDAFEENLPVEDIVHWLRLQAAPHVKLRLADHLPVIDKVTVSPGTIRVGDQFTVRLETGPLEALEGLFFDFTQEGNGLRLIKEKPLKLIFRAKRAGSFTLHLMLVNKSTLLCSTETVTINVQNT